MARGRTAFSKIDLIVYLGFLVLIEVRCGSDDQSTLVLLVQNKVMWRSRG